MDMPTVMAAARSVRSGERTAVSIVEECVAAIDGRNPSLNAFDHLDAEGALRTAAAVDAAVAAGRGDALGPLAGVPFGVKDLEDCAGMPTTRGSRWFAGQPPVEHDDIHVARLRAAGAIPLGKTASPEFGAWAYTASPALGVTRNPWDLTRTPGGSSGGSSAAVSAGLVPFCTASDGGGSIRTPASFTGLVGLKPTYGRIPTLGVTHLAQNAVVGSLATTVADTALLLDVMAGPDLRDRTCLPPPGVYGRIEGADMFVGIDPSLWHGRLHELDPRVAPGWSRAATVTLPKLARVEEARRRLVHRVAAAFDEFDVLLTPMSCRPAFAAEGPMPTEVAAVHGHAGMAVIHGMLANLANLPAASVPAGLSADGLPVGLQIIGPRYREDVVLAVARRYELARPWPRHAPT